MKRTLIVVLALAIFPNSVMAEQKIELGSSRRPLLLIQQDSPMVYKPTRLIIGKENKFSVKAPAGSYVSIVVSTANTEESLIQEQKISLTPDLASKEGVIPDNGLLEIGIDMPDKKDLNGKNAYFAVVVWKNKDLSDIKLAKIMGAAGREVSSNAIAITLPPEDASKPTFSPSMPGAPMDMMNTIKFMEELKSSGSLESDQINDMQNIYQTPVILRNLNSPDVNRK